MFSKQMQDRPSYVSDDNTYTDLTCNHIYRITIIYTEWPFESKDHLVNLYNFYIVEIIQVDIQFESILYRLTTSSIITEQWHTMNDII